MREGKFVTYFVLRSWKRPVQAHIHILTNTDTVTPNDTNYKGLSTMMVLSLTHSTFQDYLPPHHASVLTGSFGPYTVTGSTL